MVRKYVRFCIIFILLLTIACITFGEGMQTEALSKTNAKAIINAVADSGDFKLNKTSAVLAVTETLQLSVKNRSGTAKWTTSNKKIATVSSAGKVRAKATGEVNISAKVGGKNLTCLIKVQKYRLSASEKEISINEKLTLKVLGDIKNKTIKWSSSDSNIASVNKKGVLTAKKQGKVKISASIDGKKYTRTFTVISKQGEDETMPKVNIQVGSTSFKAVLYDNASARAFLAQMPLTLNMSELNGNEKYYYLSDSLPTDTQRVGNIKTGDLMLYGSDCLVLFYESFSTSYSYTKLGYIEDISELANALGHGSVKITFSTN